MMRLRTLALVLLFAAAQQGFAISVQVDARPETCGNVNGAAWALGNGGTPPYTYAWTGPNSYTAAGDSIYGLEAGTYTVTVTDNVGAMASANTTVLDLANLPDGIGGCASCAASLVGYWGGACINQCNGVFAFYEQQQGGTGNISYSFGGSQTYLGQNGEGMPVYGDFCLGDAIFYTYTDELGCPGSAYFEVYGMDEGQQPSIQQVQGSCSDGASGSIWLVSQTFQETNYILSLAGQEIGQQYIWGAGDIIQFNDLAPGTYDLLVDWPATQCEQQMQVFVPDLGTQCGTLSGTSWYDLNGDCVNDAGEPGIPYSVLLVEPGDYYGITHADGSYSMDLPVGNYTLAQSNSGLEPICPAVYPAPFTLGAAPVIIDLANESNIPFDLDLHTVGGAARPGFAYDLHGYVSNTSPFPSGPVTLTITFDPQLTYTSATPAPTSVVGNVITWEFPAFNSFAGQSVHVNHVVPVSTQLGTVLSSTFLVSNTLPEATLTNNTGVVTRTVTGSYDPNVKEVLTSSQESSTQYFIGTDNYLDYTIQFQNTGTDTAFTVVVTDTLDAVLDMGRFEQGVSSHPCTVDFLPGRVVRWTFDNILLVDSTTNEAGSHGLTNFRIRLQEPVLPGTVVTNNADIFFDFNDPIRTPDVSVVTETSTGVNASTRNDLVLHPNPSSGTISITGHALVNVNVVDLSGRELYALQMPPTDVVGCDLSALPAGVYAVRVRANDGAVSTLRLVMQ